MNIKNIAYFFITSIAVVITLIYGKSLLIPFLFALLTWFVIKEIRNVIDRIEFIRTKFPVWLKSAVSTGIILLSFFSVSKIITSSIDTLSKSYKKYEANVDSIVHQINDTFNIDLLELIAGQTGDIDFGSILGSIFSSISDIIGNTFMILIYILFVFLEQANFKKKLKLIFTDNDQFEQVNEILDRIEVSISKYLGLKTLVSFITGILSYFALLMIGIDSPIFWALLIFILNFIPTIGSLIGTVFPAIFCLLQFGDLTSGAIVLGVVGLIQVLVGNILEPKLMGNSMNISPLVAIMALSFWGVIWGVTGMILSVPITVIMIIVFSQFKSTKGVAIMLSEKGIISEED